MLDGKVKGFIVAGREPGRRLGAREAAPARAGEARLARRARPRRDRDRRRSGTTSPEIETRRAARPRRSRPRCSSCRPRSHLEKDGSFTNTQRLLQWHYEGGRAAGRLPLRALVLLPPRPKRSASGSRLDGPARPPVQRADLGLPDARAGSTSRAPRRCSPRSTAADADGKPLSGYKELKRRRLDALRLLDLLRRLRRRRQPGRAPQAALGAGAHRARVGLGVAGEPAAALQPRLGRPRRQAVVGAQAATSGGTRPRAKWTGVDTPDFDDEKRARLRAARRREGPGRDRRRPPVHHAGRRARLAVRPAGPRRRAAADALRAARVAVRATRSTRQRANPARQTLRAAREPVQPESSRPALSRSSPRPTG